MSDPWGVAAVRSFGLLVGALFGVLLAFANPNSNVLHKLTVTPLLGELNTQFGETRDWAFLTVSDAVDAVLRFEPPLRPVKLQMDE